MGSASQKTAGFVEERIKIDEISRFRFESLPEGLGPGMPVVETVHEGNKVASINRGMPRDCHRSDVRCPRRHPRPTL